MEGSGESKRAWCYTVTHLGTVARERCTVHCFSRMPIWFLYVSGAPPPPKTDPNRVPLTGTAFHNNVSLAVVLLSVHKGTTFLLLEQILSQKS